MTTALIGSTGFVGSTLLREVSFDATYHSPNINQIEGRDFDLVVCAGAPAAKWKANKEPEADLANIQKLMGHISRAKVRRFVLVSTIDVYPTPVGVDENTVPNSSGGAYGANRLVLEKFAKDNFGATVIRLPGLFGEGLKKNAVYDLINDNCLDVLQPLSSFQFYDMSELWRDIQRLLEKDVKLVNLVTEPVTLDEIATQIFGRKLPPLASQPARYDARTRHAALWGRSDGYIQGKGEVLERMKAFVEAERSRGVNA